MNARTELIPPFHRADPGAAILRIVRRGAALTAALVLALGTGCDDSAVPSGDSMVAVNVDALSAASIARTTLTVGPGVGTPDFSPIVTDLTSQDAPGNLSWTAYVQGIPAGTGRTFRVEAFDSSSAVIYSGYMTADIFVGHTASVSLVLEEANPSGDFAIRLPVVDSLTASAALVANGASVRLHVGAHSADNPQDVLSFQWDATCGSMADPLSTDPTWTAPALAPSAPTPCQISVRVGDQYQGSVTAYLVVVYQAVTTGDP